MRPEKWATYTEGQKAYILKKRGRGISKARKNMSPEENSRIGRAIAKSRMKTYAEMSPEAYAAHKGRIIANMKLTCRRRRSALVEVNVERINDYAGIVTESQMRELNG